jgi:hypothetical protein
MATPGWVTSPGATPSVQVTTFSQPRGRPASSSTPARARAVSGVTGDGLSTTGQPAATAGATLWHTRLSGKLNGVTAATTPNGTRLTRPRRPSPRGLASSGTISPERVRATAAEKRSTSTARATSARELPMGLAASAAISRAKVSARSSRRVAARSRIPARRWAGRWGPR